MGVIYRNGIRYSGGANSPSSNAEDILNKVYPVGSVYISFNSANPSELFGGGKWEKIEGMFLLGASEEHSVEETGGEETTTLTVEQMPSHKHSYSVSASNGTGTGTTTARTGANLTHSSYTGSIGNSKPHNNMPPYIAVYMWRRVE